MSFIPVLLIIGQMTINFRQSFSVFYLFKALSALSSQAANLSSKLEAALKQQEQFFKKTLKQHSAKVSKVN